MPKLTEKQKKVFQENVSVINLQSKALSDAIAKLGPYAAGDKTASLLKSLKSDLNQINVAVRRAREINTYTDKHLDSFLQIKSYRHEKIDIHANINTGRPYERVKRDITAIKADTSRYFEGSEKTFLRNFFGMITYLCSFFGAPENRNLLAEKAGRNLFFPTPLTEKDQSIIDAQVATIEGCIETMQEAFGEIIALEKQVDSSTIFADDFRPKM